MGLNLAILLDQAARRSPHRVAIRFEAQVYTYKALDEQARRFAGHLRAQGIEAGDRVGLLMPNVPEFPIAYFGALRAGAVIVPMNPLLRAREIEYYLKDSGTRFLLAWHEALDAAREAAHGVGARELVCAGPAPDGQLSLTEVLDQSPPAADMAQREPGDPAVLLYTSGTSGQPKGALLTHSNLLWNAEVSIDLHRITPEDRLLGTLPLFHSFGQTCVLNAAFRAAAEVVLMARFEAAAALSLIEAHAVSLFLGVPTMYIGLLQAATTGEHDLRSLRLCVSGGAAIPVEVLRAFEERFGCRVLEGYGLSETSPVASFNHLDRPSKPGSIGTPIWGTEMRVADDAGNPVPAGEVGEIQIRGHNVMAGYHNRPDETAATIDTDGWFHTGDLARIDADGYFFIVDRKKDLIIRGGYNVYPREVEEVLYAHPDVVEAAVVGVPDPVLGEEVAAAIVVRPGARIDVEELIGWVRAQVAPYKYPRYVVLVPELPKGPSGKILRRELPAGLFALARA